MSDQSWNNTWGSAAQLFLVRTDHQIWGIFSMVTPLQTTQHKTNKHQPKYSHANQLISMAAHSYFQFELQHKVVLSNSSSSWSKRLLVCQLEFVLWSIYLRIYLSLLSLQRQPPQLWLEKLFSRKSVIRFQVCNKFWVLNSFWLGTGGAGVR